MSHFKHKLKNKLGMIITIIVLIIAAALWWFFNQSRTAHLAVERYVQEVRERPGKSIDKLAPFPTYLPIPYAGDANRSPFQQKVSMPEVLIGEGPDLNRPRGELEAFALDALRMVGVVTQGSRMWAIVQAPDSTVYRVSVGDFIGKNYGEIIEISPTDIQISEAISDGRGAWSKRSATLTLSEK